MKEITVIGNAPVNGDIIDKALYGAAPFLSGVTRTGEIYMTDVRGMVTRVLAAADGDKVTRLNILDHASKNGGWFGADDVNVDTFENFAPFLAKLYPAFAKTGIVHLQHCKIGLQEDLLRMFAVTFGIAVYAGTGDHNPVYRFNFGDYVRCSPSGTIYHDVFRP